MEAGSKTQQLWLSGVISLSLSISAFNSASSGESEEPRITPFEENNYTGNGGLIYMGL